MWLSIPIVKPSSTCSHYYKKIRVHSKVLCYSLNFQQYRQQNYLTSPNLFTEIFYQRSNSKSQSLQNEFCIKRRRMNSKEFRLNLLALPVGSNSSFQLMKERAHQKKPLFSCIFRPLFRHQEDMYLFIVKFKLSQPFCNPVYFLMCMDGKWHFLLQKNFFSLFAIASKKRTLLQLLVIVVFPFS